MLMGRRAWRAEEEEEHAAHKQVPDGSVGEEDLGGRGEVEVAEVHRGDRERRNGCKEE